MAGLVLAAAGAAAWWSQGTEAVPHSAPPAAAARPAGGSTAPAPEPVRAKREPGAPLRVRIPALDVDAPVRPVHAPGGTLVPPDDPQQLGWWADGARPGAARGSVLVTGHTVHTGGGALDDLEQMRPGDPVVVRTDRGAVQYAVTRVRVLGKRTIAREAARLFSQRVPGRLVLVTCEGWDGQGYRSNVVVTASPQG